MWHRAATLNHPPPRPSPTRGEGEDAARQRSNSATMGLDPCIHLLRDKCFHAMDRRVKPGEDGRRGRHDITPQLIATIAGMAPCANSSSERRDSVSAMSPKAKRQMQ